MSSSNSNTSAQPALESHPWKAICSVSLFVPIYFMLLGYFGDDYSFHLSSWIGIAQDWRSGIFLPAWFAQANFGLGEPRFYFYPPLSVFLGGALLSVFPERTVPALVPWLAVFLSGLSMLHLARHLQPERAVRSALLYCTSYYVVITIVMRYAIGEAFVAAVLPWIVLYAIRLFASEHRHISLRFTALLAFAWLTNIPAALVVFYILLFSSALLSAAQRQLRPLLSYLFAQALAIGLSAWYLVPAVMARAQLTTTSLAAKFPWRDYTFFHHPHNPLARSMTWPLWIWAIAGFAFVLTTAIQHRRGTSVPAYARTAWIFIVALGCLPFFFELPQSSLLWNLPAVKLVAFSVRFLPFVAIALSLLVPRVSQPLLRRAAYALWIVWALLPVAERVGRSHLHGAPESYASLAATIRQGIGGMSEYLPVGIDTPADSAVSVAALRRSSAPCATTPLISKPQYRLSVSHAQQPCLFEPGLFFFPEWLANVDGNFVTTQRSTTGLLQIQLPAGEHRVEVYFQRPQRPRWLGLAITVLAIVLLAAGSRFPSCHAA